MDNYMFANAVSPETQRRANSDWCAVVKLVICLMDKSNSPNSGYTVCKH